MRTGAAVARAATTDASRKIANSLRMHVYTVIYYYNARALPSGPAATHAKRKTNELHYAKIAQVAMPSPSKER